jgi:glycosyltransferase involved in cell wall biosynthesis
MLGGGEHSFRDLVFNLPESWCSIAVFPNEGELVQSFKENNMETQVIQISSIRPWLFVNMYKTYKNFCRLCNKYKPELIYANGSRAAFYGGITGKKFKIPTVWHCRVANPDRYLDQILAKLSTIIIANSKATLKRFRPKFINKVSVVYNGIDYDWLKAEQKNKLISINKNWKVVLIAARISKWKRHDLALDAFERVAKIDPDIHLICIGAKDKEEPEWWSYLWQKTNRSKYRERIHWIGQVDDVRPWYKAAKILILPSENEPFGRVLVEAMAMGVPVIASQGGGVTEIIKDNVSGILTTPGNDKEIASSIIKILDNENFRRRMIIQAQERAKKFDLNAHVESMTKIFDGLIEQHNYLRTYH